MNKQEYPHSKYHFRLGTYDEKHNLWSIIQRACGDDYTVGYLEDKELAREACKAMQKKLYGEAVNAR